MIPRTLDLDFPWAESAVICRAEQRRGRPGSEGGSGPGDNRSAYGGETGSVLLLPVDPDAGLQVTNQQHIGSFPKLLFPFSARDFSPGLSRSSEFPVLITAAL